MAGLFRKKTAPPIIDEEAAANGASPAAPPAVGARGQYDIDEHILSPREVAERYGTVVDWKSIQTSKGLTKDQVRAGMGGGCSSAGPAAGSSCTASADVMLHSYPHVGVVPCIYSGAY